MAAAKAIDTSHPDLRTWSPGKMKLDCIMLRNPDANIPSPPLGTFPTYCFDPANDLLRVSMKSGSEMLLRNAFGRFQERNVVLDQAILNGALKVVNAHVSDLETSKADDSSFIPSDEMEPRNLLPSPGRALKSVAPVYPQAAKEKHISGAVHLAVTIDRGGRIATLRVTDAPDPSLASSAITAVRQWTYKPFLVNGVPAEVDTMITINFNFSAL